MRWDAHTKLDIIQEADAAFPNETGGILLGHCQKDFIHITHAIGPGPNAHHQRSTFTPDRDWQYERIDELFSGSQDTLAYLGDWHTHPQGLPCPSKTDLALLNLIAKSPESQCPAPIMCILAPDATGEWFEMLFFYDLTQGEARLHLL
ncbi:Mov34/MPN/PAD-1 family protein [Pseudarthrobacter enclensis]|uniref:Integrative and conjugative element protein (TIGR02256 family) n=1 Tax=Pseudarthrobacter enclensis TaxID=993070 RepID=A0ABT9RZ41_9MICC|nr:Mov34/MPN/PAD-1 family protein [Pseudarthrobacter enclensis]MDP9890520.1 integrative and conjugative element protein (TIGR02256 family) [Pseudarthrobacter enclensis]